MMIDFKEYSLSENVEGSLIRLIDTGSFPHATMLIGGSESSALSLARDISSALLCSKQNVPCGVCSNCIKSKNQVHPDLTIISPSGGRKSITIDEIRDMINDSFVIPNEADRKIYIITSAHLLSEQTQNALLKVLEEPQKYAYFILLCANNSAMLPTVMSRVTTFTIGEAEAVNDELYEKAVNKAAELVKGTLAINELELLKATADFDKDKKLMVQSLICYKEIVHSALLFKVGKLKESNELGLKLTLEELNNLIKVSDDILTATDRNANNKLTMTRISAEIRHAIGG